MALNKNIWPAVAATAAVAIAITALLSYLEKEPPVVVYENPKPVAPAPSQNSSSSVVITNGGNVSVSNSSSVNNSVQIDNRINAQGGSVVIKGGVNVSTRP